MLEAVPLWRVMQECEELLQALKRKPLSHTINPLEFHVRLCGLELARKLAEQLLRHGFDEVYVPRMEEAVTFRPGWLPLHGSDLLNYLRALRAAGVHRSYLQRANYEYFQSPRIRVIEDAVYVDWPEGVYSGYETVLIRLDDASLGERFTSGVEFSEVGRELLGRFRGRLKALLKTAYTVSVHDYLRVAGRVRGYAVRLYVETGFPVQMLRPYLTAANPLYVLREDWIDIMLAGRIGYPVGHLRPYDPRFGLILAKPTLLYDTPKLVELEGEDLFKTLSTMADSGTLIHRGEDGAELYLLNTPGV